MKNTLQTNKMLTLLRILIIMISITGLVGCTGLPVEKMPAPLVATSAAQKEVKTGAAQVIGIIGDPSVSFQDKVTPLSPQLLLPLKYHLEKQNVRGVLTVAMVEENSDVPLIRFVSIPRIKDTTVNNNEANNPWMTTDSTVGIVKKETDSVNMMIAAANEISWNEFTNSLYPRVNRQPAKLSDVAHALSRTVLSLEENTHAKKFLISLTDYKDDYGTSFITVPPDIEVLIVGLGIDFDVEKVLRTRNYKRFENMDAAISYITNNQ